MIEIFDDIEQGSPEWFAIRAGLPTASEFATVMSEGRADGTMPNAMIDAMVKSGCTAAQLAAAVKASKSRNSNPAAMRARYMRQLAGEVIQGEPAPDGYNNAFMDRGKALEDDARRHYAFMHDVEPRRVGFIRNGPKGCSPDSLIGTNGGLEIKIAIPAVQIERLQSGKLPSEHIAQVQGNIWVTEREWWDFKSYCPRMPDLTIRAHRNDTYIAKLEKAVDAFNEELAELVERIRGYGDPDRLRTQLIASNSYAQNVMAG